MTGVDLWVRAGRRSTPLRRPHRFIRPAVLYLAAIMLFACSAEPPPVDNGHLPAAVAAIPEEAFAHEPLPSDLVWLTNLDDPLFADPQARKGGTLHQALLSFPLTFRVVGPDSNSSFRSAILDNQMSLIGIHPNTLNIIPELATHWAYGRDKKTMYFKLDPQARWSDGVPVTAGDFAYTLEFMRSQNIVAPWYNDYYTKEIEQVIIYDDITLAVVSTKAEPDLHLKLGIGPTPRHYFGRIGEDFTQKYNWMVVPNTGPYQIDKFKKGRFVRFKRKADWWAADRFYFRNRYNVDRVLYKVIRDNNLQWEYFKKGRLDAFPATPPSYWYIKTDTEAVKKGYVHKMWFFNDTPQSAAGFWLNQDREIFKPVELRYAFAHAMNVQKVIDEVLQGDYLRLENAYVGYGAYSNPQIKARRYDIARVEQYMRSAGWQRGPDGIWQSQGRRFSVEVVYYNEEHTPRLVVFKEEAKKAGIELQLARLDPSAAFKKILEKRHDVAVVGWSTGLRPHFWEFWHSENAHKGQTNNITNTDDPELDRLIDSFRNSLEERERIDLAHRIEAKIEEIGAFVPTFMVPYFREVYWRWWRFPQPPATRSSGSLFDPFSTTAGGLFWFDAERYAETRAAMEQGRTFPEVISKDETYKP